MSIIFINKLEVNGFLESLYSTCVNKQMKQVQCEDMIDNSLEIIFIDHPCLKPNEDASEPPKKK
jgi:hypothetical protein